MIWLEVIFKTTWTTFQIRISRYLCKAHLRLLILHRLVVEEFILQNNWWERTSPQDKRMLVLNLDQKTFHLESNRTFSNTSNEWNRLTERWYNQLILEIKLRTCFSIDEINKLNWINLLMDRRMNYLQFHNLVILIQLCSQLIKSCPNNLELLFRYYKTFRQVIVRAKGNLSINKWWDSYKVRMDP